MNYIAQAVSTNGMALMLLISLLLNFWKQRHDKRDASRLFLLMLLSNMVQCVVEPITIIIDGKQFDGAVPLATALNSLLYMNNILFALLWSLYADAKVSYGRKAKVSVWTVLRQIPALCVIAGAVLNLFMPVYFRITPENVYQRTNLFLGTYVVTYFYLILGTVNIYQHRKETENFNFLPVVSFLLPVCLASVIQFLVPGISLLWGGAALGIASAYVNLLDENTQRDPLSGLFSRHYLNRYMTALPKKIKPTPLVLGIMLDVDDFKSINDTYGHLTGDDAIAGVGDILRRAVTTDRMLFRYAGDEFVVIMPIQSEDEIARIIGKIHNSAEYFNLNQRKPYSIRFSLGYTLYIPGESGNAFIERMDREMYKNKKNKDK